ncbi:hypothetical protein EVAR_77506_1 [Eumeta japonica]|uniref:Uncharacterized protein n=1 Tax=Eumeta variegata TaxID=151549 RepID=A0A4C1T6F5_EUMVA|nr:hypothetical protein EVAR_77506_1 [Eumeta japonica]
MYTGGQDTYAPLYRRAAEANVCRSGVEMRATEYFRAPVHLQYGKRYKNDGPSNGMTSDVSPARVVSSISFRFTFPFADLLGTRIYASRVRARLPDLTI